jgi:Ca-activated chloride channel family protein
LAEPVIYRQKPIFKRSGVDIVVGIDISKSMLAEDSPLPPNAAGRALLSNRLNQARLMVLDLLDQLEGERIGVFVFAGESYELVPLTTDYGYCRYLVENLNELAVSAPGSNLAAGLETGFEMLGRKSEETAGVIILIGDGEDSSENSAALIKLAEKTETENCRIYSVGVGQQSASLIPIRTPDGRQIIGYYEDEQGNFLTTSLEPVNLETLAAEGRGRYWPLDREPLAPVIMKQVLSDLRRSGRATVYENQPYVLSSWLLGLAFVTFLLTL